MPPRRLAPTPIEPVYYREILDAQFGGGFRVNRVRNVFDEAMQFRIDEFIGMATLSNLWQRATIIDETGVERVDETRLSESVAIDDHDMRLANDIRRLVASRVFGDARLARAQCAGADAKLQIQRYPPGGFFDWHHDSISFPDDAMDDEMLFPRDAPQDGESRMLTAFVYLNDGTFTGGTTEFTFANDAVQPEAYMVAAWPNYKRVDAGQYRPDRLAVHKANAIQAVDQSRDTFKYGMNVWFCLKSGTLALESPSTLGKRSISKMLHRLPQTSAASLRSLLQ